MPFPRMTTRRWIVAVAIVGIGFGLIRGCILLYQKIEAWGVAMHQQSVTKSLAEWGQESAVVRDWSEADHAIDMLEYVQHYYVTGPGYRGDPVTEAALEKQRERTLNMIASALREYTGQDFGVDATRWRAWAARQSQLHGEPDAPPDPPEPERATR